MKKMWYSIGKESTHSKVDAPSGVYVLTDNAYPEGQTG